MERLNTIFSNLTSKYKEPKKGIIKNTEYYKLIDALNDNIFYNNNYEAIKNDKIDYSKLEETFKNFIKELSETFKKVNEFDIIIKYQNIANEFDKDILTFKTELEKKSSLSKITDRSNRTEAIKFIDFFKSKLKVYNPLLETIKDTIIKIKNSLSDDKDYIVDQKGLYTNNELFRYLDNFERTYNNNLVEFYNKLKQLALKINKDFFTNEKLKELLKERGEGLFNQFETLREIDTIENINKKYTDIKNELESLKKEGNEKKITLFLNKYKEIFKDEKDAEWQQDFDKADIPNDKNLIISVREFFQSLLAKYSPEDISIKSRYKAASDFYEDLIKIKNQLEKDKRVNEDDLKKIDNFEKKLQEIKAAEKDPGNAVFKDIIKNINITYSSIKSSEIYKKIEKLEELKKSENKEDIEKYYKEKDELIIDPNVIYFRDYISIFKLSLNMLVYLSIGLLLFILLLSIVAFLKLLYEIILNIIVLFVNTNTSTKGSTLEYLSKTIIKCTKDNFDNDRFYILTEQKTNISLFNISVYMIYLLLIYLFLYFILFLYAKMMDKTFVGDLTNIDKNNLFLGILVVIIIYSVIHLMIYKLIFKKYVYIPYKQLDKREEEIDSKIAEYILIRNQEGEILVDNNFFKILYDPSRIDELNEIFEKGIETEDNEKCLEQKIIIYNIYNYFREYIVFDSKMQETFKDYCTSEANNKPIETIDSSTKEKIKTTFLSLLDNDQIKIIKKYNEELPYYNNIADDKLEFFNELNENISNKLDSINKLIIVNTNTSLPLFITIFYIIFIIFLNFFVIYIIIVMVLTKKDSYLEFNNHIYKLFMKLNEYIYNPIIQAIIKK